MTNAVIISASYDKQVRFWDAVSGRTVRCFSFQDSQVNALLVIPDTTYLVVAGFGVIRVYDIATSAVPAVGTATGGSTSTTVPNTSGQTPSLLSSFECQDAMNFTSLGSFPLIHNSPASPEHDSTATESTRSSIAVGNSFLYLGDLMGTIMAGDQQTNAEVGIVLYATSEDGRIRFFDAKSSSTPRLLREISTGAAITCSALSPDRRYLITGSQIGQISIWHVPSIMASVSADAGVDVTQARSTRDAESGTPESVNVALFGTRPLQEMAFPDDYTSIRSISIEALARWAVIATNAGKVHFIRLAHDKSVGGMEAAEAAAKNPEAGCLSDNSQGTSSFPPPGGRRGSGVEIGPPVHRERIYRSALVVNELSQFGRAAELRGNAAGNVLSGASGIGAAILDNLEREHTSSVATSGRGSCFATLPPGGVGKHTRGNSVAGAGGSMHSTVDREVELQMGLEFEVFHSFQAHHKYILKVVIAPNSEFLFTCSADYTIGRFLVPQVLQRLVNRVTVVSRNAEGNARGAVSHGLSLTSTQPPEEQRGSALAGEKLGAPLVPMDQPPSPSAISADVCTPAANDDPPSAAPRAKVNVSTLSSPTEKTSPTHPADALLSTPAKEDKHSFDSSAACSLPTDAQLPQHNELPLYFKALPPLTGHSRWVWDCVISDCCQFLFSASSDSTLRMWKGLLTDRPQSTSFVGHTKPVIAVLIYYEKPPPSLSP